MRICFVAPANNYHTKKWCKWFVGRGHEVHVISFINDEIEKVTVHFIDAGVDVGDSDIKKLKYLLQGRKIRRVIDIINPDVVSVHYATSYGMAVALGGLKGYVLSVWGADIYDFPQKSALHKLMLKYSLSKPAVILSTSNAMAEETKKYLRRNITIDVTPFGVDTTLFTPEKRKEKTDDTFTVGTIKLLAPKYGIDYIIEAVSLVNEERPDINIHLRIAGKGPQEQEYRVLAKERGIEDITTWLGFISQEQVAEEWANMDVGIVASTLDSESFGVSAVEAEASGITVIISDIPGLMEATNPNETSVVVTRKNARKLADAIVMLYEDKERRQTMGTAGRQFVIDNYELNHCFEHIEDILAKYRLKSE